MHEQGAETRGFGGQDAGRVGIDALGALGLGFGAIHVGVRGCVRDDLRLEAAHHPTEVVGILEIGAQTVASFAAERSQIAEWSQGALQLPAHLAAAAEQKNLHRSGPRRVQAG